MLKIYKISTAYGDYNEVGLNEYHAKRKAYRKYKKTRKTNFEKFQSCIYSIEEIR